MREEGECARCGSSSVLVCRREEWFHEWSALPRHTLCLSRHSWHSFLSVTFSTRRLLGSRLLVLGSVLCVRSQRLISERSYVWPVVPRTRYRLYHSAREGDKGLKALTALRGDRIAHQLQ